jgi:hypothetical protein
VNTIAKKVVGFLVAVAILFGISAGAIIAVAIVTIQCGIALISPFDEARDIFGNAKEGVSDAFFDIWAPADQKKRKANAALIVKIGEERNFSPYSIGIAVATAIQESNLENLPYLGAKNDHRSLGLFQQQPPWWGTPEQILDPTYATNKFYDSLQEVYDRDSRPMIDVAIQVQIPDEAVYRKTWPADREDKAMSIVKDNYTGDGKVGDNCTSSAANTTGWRLPLNPKVYNVSSPFGWRCLFVCKNHDGVDMAAAAQTPIFAAHDGEVTFSGVNGSYGNFVRIDHGGGIVTEYGHMIRFEPGVVKGTSVRGGQVIGYVGSTGGSTGNHLHFNTKIDGKYVDPVPYMLTLGVDIKGSAR